MKTIYGSRRCRWCKNLLYKGIVIRTTYKKRNKYYCNEHCYTEDNAFDKVNYKIDLKNNVIEFVKIKSILN